MVHYHSVIIKKDDKGPVFAFNLTKEQSIDIINSLNAQKSFMFSNNYVVPAEVDNIRFVETEKLAKEILAIGKKKRSLEKAFKAGFGAGKPFDVDAWFIIQSGKDVTKQLTKEAQDQPIKANSTEKVEEDMVEEEDFQGMPNWRELSERITKLQMDIGQFKVEFVDRDSFKRFCNDFYFGLRGFNNICISGYFSETLREDLEKILALKSCKIRLISPEFQLGSNRDKKNLEALRKLTEAGAEVKLNYRLHARLLIAYTTFTNTSPSGLLVIGSFDYNTDCIGRERYDAGIKTSHPDLVLSAINFFEQVWKDSETQALGDFLKEKKI